MTKYHYVYALKEQSSGRFYIGKRSSLDKPKDDPYLGSGNWPQRCRAKGKILRKIVIRVLASELEAYQVEKELVVHAKALHPTKCMNLSDGGQGLTSDAGKLAWKNSSPERRIKAGERGAATSRRLGLSAIMQAARTPESMRADGIKGGSAGKGVSRNAGDKNGMRRVAENSLKVRNFHLLGTSTVISGNWHEIKEVFGKVHCARLLIGKVSRGLRLIP